MLTFFEKAPDHQNHRRERRLYRFLCFFTAFILSFFCASQALAGIFAPPPETTFIPGQDQPLSLQKPPVIRPFSLTSPLPYQTVITPTPDSSLNNALNESSLLLSLENKLPVSFFALLARARTDAERLQQVCASFGYYNARILIRSEGIPVNSPQFLADLEKNPPQEPVPITVTPETESLFHISRIRFLYPVPASALHLLSVKPGDPVVAPTVIQAQINLIEGLKEEGYALARAPTPMVIPDRQANTAELIFAVKSGPVVYIGPVYLHGLRKTDPAFIRKLITLKPGTKYSPLLLNKIRARLLHLDIFTSVEIENTKKLNENHRLPLTFQFNEAPPYSFTAGGKYSTDQGIGAEFSWSDHNVFSRAETFTLTAAANNIAGLQKNAPGYSLIATFTKPDIFNTLGQNLTNTVGAVREFPAAYDRTAVYMETRVTHPFTPRITGTIGIGATQEKITQEGISTPYTMLYLPLEVKYSSVENPLNPTQGLRVIFRITPTQSFIENTTSLADADLSAATYFDLEKKPGYGVLALRGEIGTILGGNNFTLPPNLRFYAGGINTVRGYEYQMAGPLFPNNIPEGGKALTSYSISFRQRFFSHWGVNVFYDMAKIGTSGIPFSGPMFSGIGFGPRYYTSFGPLRLDIAFPLKRLPGSSAFQIYIGLGQDF